MMSKNCSVGHNQLNVESKVVVQFAKYDSAMSFFLHISKLPKSSFRRDETICIQSFVL